MEGRDLARLAVLAFVRGWFLPDWQLDLYSRDGLWNHSVAVGAVAAVISRTCGCGDPSLVFVAGSLHDIGLCANERLDGESFAEVIGCHDELSPLHEVEQDLLGWDHTQLGETVLTQWGMPEPVRLAARHHHAPEAVIGGPHGETVGCVAIANYLCSRSGWGSTRCHALTPPGQEVFRHLGIDAGVLMVLWQQLYPALDSVAQLR
jgi:putative nucleotidyltransferase with HDIG domain